MVNSKPETTKRRKTIAGGLAATGSGVGKKGKSGSDRKNRSRNEDDETHAEKGKKGRGKGKEAEKGNKLSAGGGKKKSSTKISGAGLLKVKESAMNLTEMVRESTLAMKTLESEDHVRTTVSAKLKATRSRPQKVQSKASKNYATLKRGQELLNKREMNQKDLDLIERAKTCYEEANKIWKMAWEIICERFYTLNAPLITVHELRDTWRRLIQQHWMDEDYRNGAYPPDKLLIQDTPPLPLALDSWARGAIEMLPEAKRESVMDPFIRDLDNFLPLSNTRESSIGTKVTFPMGLPEKKPIHEARKERQKSVMVAHTRRKTMFIDATIPLLGDIKRDPATPEITAEESTSLEPGRTQISIMSLINSSVPASIRPQLFDKIDDNEMYDELHRGIFARFDEDYSSEDEESKLLAFKEKLNVSTDLNAPKVKTEDVKPNIILEKESIVDEPKEHITTRLFFDEENIDLLENLKGEYLEKNISTSPKKLSPKLSPPRSDPIVSDSSIHNYSSILPETESPAILTSSPSTHLLTMEHSDREKDIPKSTLSADRLDNFFASMHKNNSKDSIFGSVRSERAIPSTESVDDDSEITGYAYSEDSLISYDNLSEFDKKVAHTFGNLEEYDSDSGGSINSSSSSFQSSFSSDSERAFSP